MVAVAASALLSVQQQVTIAHMSMTLQRYYIKNLHQQTTPQSS